jgi:DNA polymerase I-like protein with 3'-5' exonuclease and polymerase domains
MPPEEEVWSVDSEWGFRGDRIGQESVWEPVVLCVVGVRSGHRLFFWAWDPALKTFFREHAEDTFVAHNAVAEMKYLIRHGIMLPVRWFDTFVAWRYLTNRPGNLEAGLTQALVQLGLPGRAPGEKEQLRQKILHLRFDPDNAADRREIVDYCFSDCDGCAALYETIQARVPTALMAHWVEFLKAVARMELRGIPFDTQEYLRIRSMRSDIKARLIAHVNATWPVFDDETFKARSFLNWCRERGIDWPVKVSDATGKRYHPMDKDTFKEMEARHPFIAELRQVRKTLKQFARHDLIIDPVRRRHYYSTSVFRSVTGRNQPRGFVFGGPKWLRWLIVPESPDHVLVYVDFVAQEVGIAAALSRDPVMRAVYEADDCHMAFAIRAGAAPADATKESHAGVRKQYKTVNLGTLYGQTAFGIAARLGISYHAADRVLADHRALFPTFWAWSRRVVNAAFERRWIRTPCGWRSRVPYPSNRRTWMNWPMQSVGADIMRLTVTYLDQQNVRLLAVVHDGFLLSCRLSQLDDLQAAVNYACGTAVAQVLPGFPLRWDFTVHDRGRFEDEDGQAFWDKIQAILGELDAEPHTA